MADIKVFGADWCSMTTHTRRHLDRLGVSYEYINIDEDRAAAAWVASQNHGKEKKPTLDIKGQILSTPTDDELDDVLQGKGLLT